MDNAIILFADNVTIFSGRKIGLTADKATDWQLDRLCEMVKAVCKDRLDTLIDEWRVAVDAIVSEQTLQGFFIAQADDAASEVVERYNAQCEFCGTPLTANGICEPCADYEAACANQ